MEIRSIEAFVAVAEELHFGRAAARLRISQSPLSQTVKRLERELGSPLFERSTRSVALTAAGAAFLPHAREVLRQVESGRLATRASSGDVYGHVAIGFSGLLNHLFLPALTRAVRERHPDVELELVGRVMTGDAVDLLTDGRLDIAFVGLPIAAAGVSHRLIGQEHMGAVLPATHAAAQAGELELAALVDEGFVTTPAAAGSSLREVTARACAEAGFRPRVVQEVTDPSMLMLLVAAGVGVTLVPESVARFVPEGARFVRLISTTATMDHGLAWGTNARPSPARAAVLTLAEEVFARR